MAVNVPQPEALICTSANGSGVLDATWTNPAGGTYDEIGIFIDGIEVATLVGTATAFTSAVLPVPSFPTLCVEGRVAGAPSAQTCCAIELIVNPVSSVICTVVGTAVDVSWINPGGFDTINVFVDGVLDQTLGGGEIATSVGPFTPTIAVEVCIEGTIGMGVSAQACCNALIIGPADSETCATPGSLIDDLLPTTTEVLSVIDSLAIGDTEVLVNITHTFVGDLTMDIASPSATVVQLHDSGGIGDDNLNVLYSDAGIPNAVPYNCFCLMMPSGGIASTGTGTLG